MANTKNNAPGFDDIVFEKRNKEYGAYVLRRKYPRNVLISLCIGAVVISTAIITPYLNAVRVQSAGKAAEERVVEVVMESLDQPTDLVAPPPPPPEAPPETSAPAAYVPPVVVDSVTPEDEAQFMTADEISEVVVDEAVEDITIVTVVTEEIQEEEVEPEIQVTVEEMPFYPGGNPALLEYIYDNTEYPETARENNVQGRVTVRFCVTATGDIGKIEVMRGVDPDIDAEVIRVIKTVKGFQPGRQGGVPVPVWYVLPIQFKLEN